MPEHAAFYLVELVGVRSVFAAQVLEPVLQQSGCRRAPEACGCWGCDFEWSGDVWDGRSPC
jgi:hypothetical protein